MPGSQSVSPPQTFNFDPADASLTGFASNVTGSTWALTATEATDSLAHRVSIRNDSSNSKSSINITLVGTDADGNAQTETITGPGASATVESTLYYRTLTSVTPASTWGADTADIGWVDEFASKIIGLNWLAEAIAALNANVTGTISYTLQQTFDNFLLPSYTAPSQQVQWITVASAQTADGIFNTVGGALGVRLVVGSYSSGAEIALNVNPTYVANQPTGGGGGGSGQIGLAYSNALTITRPANQTPYNAGDVVGGALTFTNMGPNAGRIMLTSSQLELDISAIPSGMTSFFLALYNVTPPSAFADNAAWDLPSGDRASFLGIMQLGTPVDLGATLYVEQNIINKQTKLAGTSLFGYLVTVGGFTPAANSEVYVATLHAVGLGL